MQGSMKNLYRDVFKHNFYAKEVYIIECYTLIRCLNNHHEYEVYHCYFK